MVPPVLNSLPGAPATIYLDFNGHFDASWSSFSNVDTPPYDTDNNVNAWSATEIQEITDIWRFVADDYAPFNINVTTVLPPSFAIRVAQRVSIGGDGRWFDANNPPFGVGLLNGFNSGSGQTPTCYVFEAAHPYDATFRQNVAFTASHEAGHTFGLEHQIDYTQSGNPLNPGLPDGTSPLMGTNNLPIRNMWWFGTSTSATTFQDDLAVLSNATNGFGFRPDEAGGNAAAAAALIAIGTGTVNVSRSGVITQMTDADWYKITANPGPLTFTADVPEPFNNLDVKLELRNSAGALLVSSDPSTSFDATVTFNVAAAGTYILVVSSHGVSSAATGTNFGFNVGGYQLTGSFVVNPAAQGAALKLLAPVRWVYNRKARVYRGVVTLVSQVETSESFAIHVKLPHRSVRWVAPFGQRVGKKAVRITIDQDVGVNSLLRFVVTVRNPLRKPLGTFFRGLKAIG